MKHLFLTVVLCAGIGFTYTASTTAFFGPTTNLSQKLIPLLCNAKKRIYVASYLLNSAPLVRQLIAAHKRHCCVQVIVDRAMIYSPRGRQVIKQLRQHKIPTFVYHTASHPGLMHHKFAVIDTTVWAGSMNWTTAGSSRNHENVIVTNRIDFVRLFSAHFTTLKRRLHRISATTTPSSSLFFIPDHHRALRTKLMLALRKARIRIVIALYELTNTTVIAALLAAHQRGVAVTIQLDKQRAKENKRFAVLQKAGIKVHTNNDNRCFHHKYAVIDNQLWTGSMNWTHSGMYRNQEHVMILDSAAVVAAFVRQQRLHS